MVYYTRLLVLMLFVFSAFFFLLLCGAFDMVLADSNFDITV